MTACSRLRASDGPVRVNCRERYVPERPHQRVRTQSDRDSERNQRSERLRFGLDARA